MATQYGGLNVGVGTDAAAAGVIFSLRGSATSTVIVNWIEVSATATAAVIVPVSVDFRSGGAQTAGTAMTNVPMGSGFAASGALAQMHVTAPTAGTLVGPVAGGKLLAGPTATVTQILPLSFNFKARATPVILVGTTQWLTLTLGVTAGAGNTFAVSVNWTEY